MASHVAQGNTPTMSMRSNMDAGAARFGEQAEAEHGASDDAESIKALLAVIADQISDADRRHSAALSELKDRLGRLTGVAQDMREHMPREMAHELDRIETNMVALSQQIDVAEHDACANANHVGKLQGELSVFDHRFDGRDGDTPANAETHKAVLSTGTEGSLTRRDDRSGAATRAEVDRFDVVGSDEPWDELSAEALTQVYEGKDGNPAGLELGGGANGGSLDRTVAAEAGADDLQNGPVAHAAGDAAENDDHSIKPANAIGAGIVGEAVAAAEMHPEPDAERAWLESRLSEIASSLEKISHDDAVSNLTARFDRLESSLDQAMGQVANGSEPTGLQSIENQVEDLAAQLVMLQSHFSRLDSIELELKSLSERMSDEHLAKVFEEAPGGHAFSYGGTSDAVSALVNERMPLIEDSLRLIAEQLSEEKISELIGQAQAAQPDVDHMARMVAEQILPQINAPQPSAAYDGDRLEELRTLIKSFVEEQRLGDEQTNTMLDTMQQAMIRLLDRMDALENPDGADFEDDDGGYASIRNHPEASDLEEMERELAETGRQTFRTQADEDPDEDERHEPEFSPQVAHVEDRRKSRLRASKAAAPEQAPSDEPFELEDNDQPPPPRSLTRSSSRTEQKAGGDSGPGAREDFIAAARRAAREAAAAKADPDASADTVTLDPQVASEGRQKVKGKAKRRAFSPRLAIVLSCLLAAGVGFTIIKSNAMLNAVFGAKPAATMVTPKATAKGGVVDDKNVPAVNPGATNKETDGQPSGGDRKSGADATTPHPGASYGEGNAVVAPAVTRSAAGELPAIDGAAALAAANQARQSSIGALMAQSPQMLAPYSSANGSSAPTVPAALNPETPSVDAIKADAEMTQLPPVTIGPFSLRHAAAKGMPAAQFEVAARFAEGRGVRQDLKSAVVWYQRAASKGYAPAQYRLASMYERGFGVKTDIERAKIWYARAAEQGVVKAMHNLAVLSAGRNGTPPNYALATKWFTAAAQHGLMDSQFNLAIMYDGGLGVTRNPALAYKWFSIAARSGDAEAAKRRDKLRSELKADQVKRIDAEVTMWRPQVADIGINDMRVAGETWKKKLQ